MSITLKGLGSAVIAQHEAAADPHPQYLTETEADAKYALIGSGGGTGGDPAGTAAALLVDHEAAVDPHPQYLTQSEGDTLYAPKTHSHTSSQISDFSEAVEDLIGGSIIAGSGVGVTYNHSTGKTTISASGEGGGGYAVQTRNGSLAGQVHSFSLPNPQSSFGFDAYALREEASIVNQNVSQETFDAGSSVHYDHTGGLVWNGVVSPNSAPLSFPTNTPVSIGFSTERIDINSTMAVIIRHDSNVVPRLTGTSSPLGFSAHASSQFTGPYDPWYAFDGDVNEASESGNYTWVSAKAPTTDAPQWIEIRLPSAITVNGYILRNRKLPNAVTSPNTWTFQGSNDGVTWDILHTVTNDTRNAAALERSFDTPEHQAYQRYRMHITARNGSNDFVAIGELILVRRGGCIIKGSDGNYYTSNSGVLSQVPSGQSWDDVAQFAFTDSGNIPASGILASISPFYVVAPVVSDITLTKMPSPQIAIQKSLTSLSAYSRINSATVTATQTANGKVRLAVSRDLIDWFAWNGTSWAALGTLTNDTTSAEAVIANGMSPATVGSLTFSQWELLFPGGKPDKIAFAYALNVPNPPTDVASIDTVSLNVNFVAAWLKQTEAQVEIRWYEESVTFKTVNTGNYKLAYQTP